MISSLLLINKTNRSTESTHSITGVKIREELLSNFFRGMTKLANSRVMHVIKWALMSFSYNVIVLLKLELAHSSQDRLPVRNEAGMPQAAMRLEQPQALSLVQALESKYLHLLQFTNFGVLEPAVQIL